VRARPGSIAFFAALVLSSSRVASAQDIGHKVLGTMGLQAGRQPDTGLYVSDAIVAYEATTLMDRHGNAIPVGLDADAVAGMLGVAFAYEIPKAKTFVNVAIALPAAHASVNTSNPIASIDRFGLSDLFVQPLKLGWRTPRFELVTGYSLYAPTGESEPGGNDGVGRGQWTHEVSVGGSVAFDAARRLRLSALASLDVNGRKLQVDVTRGATLQIQGGLGYTLARVVSVGVAGYALWQVTDDSGSDLPPILRGARDTTYGAGPELGVVIPAIRCSLTARYEHDFESASRPQGELFFFGLTSALWRRR
jgi:hypothetical protein